MFLVRFFVMLVGLFVAWCFIVFGQSGNPTAGSQWIYDVYTKKVEIAKSIREKKMLIVSGSNALFGIDSGMIERELGIRVVNFGVNAGVMLPYTLYKAKEVIDWGDVVLMPLEYPMYSYDGVPNSQMIDYIFSRDIDAFFALTLKEQFYMLWSITFDRVYDGYFYQGGSKVTSGLYRVGNIDEHGDQINTAVRYRSTDMIRERDGIKAKRYGHEYNKRALGWEYLEEFVSWCEKREVKVIFMPSTIMRDKSYYGDEQERWFYKNIDNEIRNRGWRYVGKPYDYMYDRELYLNTPFHLVERGKEMRTKRILKSREWRIYF